MAKRAPRVNSASQKELDKVEAQFNEFQEKVEALTLDRMNEAPVAEVEPQTKMSKKEAKVYDAPYIKPIRSINTKERPNPAFKKAWERGWEYIKVIVENKEIINDTVECWTKRFPGDAADNWKVPVNKPIWVPRLLADQLSKCKYHRLRMDDIPIGAGSVAGTNFYGAMAVDETRERISCTAVENSPSFAMG